MGFSSLLVSSGQDVTHGGQLSPQDGDSVLHDTCGRCSCRNDGTWELHRAVFVHWWWQTWTSQVGMELWDQERLEGLNIWCQSISQSFTHVQVDVCTQMWGQAVFSDFCVIDNCFLILLVVLTHDCKSVVTNYILLTDHLLCNICE